MSLPEVVLWQLLRGGRLGALRFRLQHPIGPYILDFYCPAVRLAVELDGPREIIRNGPNVIGGRRKACGSRHCRTPGSCAGRA
ncbi:MAG: DUF559 domain-containing protein [Methylobacteriaceae bacterium]|nr:DUF559 domain-containing protein [Methylobacteriaceae bacterium]